MYLNLIPWYHIEIKQATLICCLFYLLLCFFTFSGKAELSFSLGVTRSESGAGAVILPFPVHPERVPDRRTENVLLRHIMHTNRNTQHGTQRDYIRADVSVAYRAVIGSPVVHDVISRRKRRAFLTIPPYGYIKDPEDKKKWIVDEEAAAVVQKIFSLCVDGLGPTQIAKWLKQHQILNPTAYAHSKGLPASNKPTADSYKWTNETVSRILERVDYLGHTVNFKTTKQSYKSKKKLWNDPADWVIFENTQPAIIEESVFIIVQNIRKSRRRPTKMGDMSIFSGLLYCA